MFESMDKIVADNRRLDMEFELMLQGRREVGGGGLVSMAMGGGGGGDGHACGKGEGEGQEEGGLSEEGWRGINTAVYLCCSGYVCCMCCMCVLCV